MKRLFDIGFSVFAIIVTLPITIPIALIIKLTDGGSIIYGHERVGKDGKKLLN